MYRIITLFDILVSLNIFRLNKNLFLHLYKQKSCNYCFNSSFFFKTNILVSLFCLTDKLMFSTLKQFYLDSFVVFRGTTDLQFFYYFTNDFNLQPSICIFLYAKFHYCLYIYYNIFITTCINLKTTNTFFCFIKESELLKFFSLLKIAYKRHQIRFKKYF